MNNAIKYTLIFAGGVGVGFLAAKQILVKGYAEQAQEEIDDVKEHYRQKYELVKEVDIDEYPAVVKLKTKPSIDETSVTSQLNKTKKDLIDYHKIHTGNSSTWAVNNPPAPVYADQLERADVSNCGSYIITDQEFADEMLHYDKITMFYYSLDDVLTDEHESIVDDVDGTVGDETLNLFADMPPSQNTIWVRNERIASDFEIVRLDQSFEDHIMGGKD